MRIALLAALAAIALPVTAHADKLPPRDECAADASLAAFRKAFAAAVQARDAKALLAMTAPDIEFEIGEASTRMGFAKEWALDTPAKSKLWAELDAILPLGCALDPGLASMPYMYARMPPNRENVDAIPGRPRVNLRVAPALDAKVVRLLDWDLLTVIDESHPGWTHVKLDDSTEGYVSSDLIRNAYSYRALFKKRGGKWMMTAFVAGD